MQFYAMIRRSENAFYFVAKRIRFAKLNLIIRQSENLQNRLFNYFFTDYGYDFGT